MLEWGLCFAKLWNLTLKMGAQICWLNYLFLWLLGNVGHFVVFFLVIFVGRWPWPHDMITKKEQEFNRWLLSSTFNQPKGSNRLLRMVSEPKYYAEKVIGHPLLISWEYDDWCLGKSTEGINYDPKVYHTPCDWPHPMVSAASSVLGWLEKCARRIRWSSVWVPQVFVFASTWVLRERFELKVLKINVGNQSYGWWSICNLGFVFYFYHDKSPLNHHLGWYFAFFQPS